MDSFDQMNNSLISANIDLQVNKMKQNIFMMKRGRHKYIYIFFLQKSLLENCQNRVDMRQEVKNLRSSFEKTQEKLKNKEQELAAAHAENQMLKLQVIMHIHL